MGTTDYTYTLSFNEDGTYQYQTSFSMKDVAYVQKEAGTYTTDKETFTLTSNGFSVTNPNGEVVFSGGAGQTMTGKITDGQAVSVTRRVSGFAHSDADLSLTYGQNGNGSDEKPETPSEDEKPSAKFQTGTYGGTYTSNTAMGTTNYAYTLTFGEDGTYKYEAGFSMRGNAYTHTETGTYTTDEGTFTLTSNGYAVTDPSGAAVMSGGNGQTMEGKITGVQAVSVTRKVCGMAMSNVELSLTYGLTPAVQMDAAAEEAKVETEEATEEKAAEEVTEETAEPEAEPDSEEADAEAKDESEADDAEVKEEPETKAADADAEPETKDTEVTAEPETKTAETKPEATAAEAKAEPETKAAEADAEVQTTAAEEKAESETISAEKEQ